LSHWVIVALVTIRGTKEKGKKHGDAEFVLPRRHNTEYIGIILARKSSEFTELKKSQDGKIRLKKQSCWDVHTNPQP
jgi:hypothetical protein